jgi:ATP-binding protein involved in chromosome partitioning
MSEQQLNADTVLQVLNGVVDPALGFGLVENELVRDVNLEDGKVSLTLVSIMHGYPYQEQVETAVREKILGLEGVSNVEITPVVEVPKDARLKGTGGSEIKTIIAVASGKGGVGKSTLAVNLAVTLAQMGARVGLMDADVYGPNIPMMMGVTGLPRQNSQETINPAEAFNVKMISIGFMVKPDQPIVWRGPMLHSAIQQFVRDVIWGELDYLVVDLPPGTGDAQLSLVQTVSVTGGVIVTLPQAVSLEDARRGLEMFRQMSIPIIGVVENMSYLELPDGQQMDIFGSGGGERMSGEAGVQFLGAVPMDPQVREGGDSGKPIVVTNPDSTVAQAFKQIAAQTALEIGKIALESKQDAVSISIE